MFNSGGKKPTLNLRVCFVSLLLLFFSLGAKAQTGEFTVNSVKYTPTSNTEVMVSGYVGTISDAITIPSTVSDGTNNYDVTSIGPSAFKSCGIPSITLQNSVTSIGKSAFESCVSLTSVTFSNSLTSIGNSAFMSCTSLGNETTITFPNSLTSIGASAFDNCHSLKSITIPNNVTSIGNSAFHHSGITSIKLSNSMTSISDSTFESCQNLTSVTIPNSVTSIGALAFHSSGLTSVSFPNSVTSISASAFNNCTQLASVSIPNSVTSIGASAFASCALTSIILPNSVTDIGSGAFSSNYNLDKVEAENPAATIGSDAFNTWGAKLYVPKSREGSSWTNYGSKLTATNRDAARSTSLTFTAGQLLTAYYHYPVDIPAGVNAYTGALNTDKTELGLTKITTGVIPGGAAVVLCKTDGTAGTVTMTESSTDSYAGTPAATALQGSITPTADLVMPQGVTDNHHAFVTGTTAAANTAFLTPSQVNAGTTSVTMVVNRSFNANEYYTLSYPFALDLTNISEAFSASAITQDEVATTSVTSGVLAANQPVLLYGSATVTSLPLSSLAGTSVSGTNYLEATTGAAIADNTATNTVYILATKSGMTQFYKLSASNRTVAENRAFLNVPTSISSKAFFGIGKGTTAIDDVFQNATEDNSAYYTLQGVRVDNPTKGLYVKKGKVIIIK